MFWLNMQPTQKELLEKEHFLLGKCCLLENYESLHWVEFIWKQWKPFAERYLNKSDTEKSQSENKGIIDFQYLILNSKTVTGGVL